MAFGSKTDEQKEFEAKVRAVDFEWERQEAARQRNDETLEEVGMILVSQKTWDKVKSEFPPPIESIYPIMGFMLDIPVRISDSVPDDTIVQIPKKMTDMFKGPKFHPPEFKVRIEPLYYKRYP